MAFSKENQGKVTEVMKKEFEEKREGQKRRSPRRKAPSENPYYIPLKVGISFKADEEVKDRAEREAYKRGLRLSAFLNEFLDEHLPK